ncbi:unnamed protein product, partial [Urochloa humidicola]
LSRIAMRELRPANPGAPPRLRPPLSRHPRHARRQLVSVHAPRSRLPCARACSCARAAWMRPHVRAITGRPLWIASPNPSPWGYKSRAATSLFPHPPPGLAPLQSAPPPVKRKREEKRERRKKEIGAVKTQNAVVAVRAIAATPPSPGAPPRALLRLPQAAAAASGRRRSRTCASSCRRTPSTPPS